MITLCICIYCICIYNIDFDRIRIREWGLLDRNNWSHFLTTRACSGRGSVCRRDEKRSMRTGRGQDSQPRHRSVSRCKMSSPTDSWIMILTWHLYATASPKTCHSHKMISFWISNDFNFSLHLCHSFTFQWTHLKKQNTTLVHRSAMCCYTRHQVLAYEALVARLQSELRWEKERRQSCDQAIRMRRSWTCEIFSWSVNRQVYHWFIISTNIFHINHINLEELASQALETLRGSYGIQLSC